MFGTSQGKLMLVADGMGGHEAGERASQLAVDSAVTYVLNTMRWCFRLDAKSDQNVREELHALMFHCQRALANEVESLPQRQGMGTTLTMAYILWPHLYVVHVGDSRCYLLRDDKLRQITRDHTLAQLAKEAFGETSPGAEEDDGSRPSGINTLWNVISANGDGLSPEIYALELQFGDALLLCTDGLYKHVRHPQLEALMLSDLRSEQICQSMIDQANDDGGTDNITVVVARFCKDIGDDACEATAQASDEPEIDLALDDTGDYVGPADALEREFVSN
jgi:protein phosphatase